MIIIYMNIYRLIQIVFILMSYYHLIQVLSFLLYLLINLLHFYFILYYIYCVTSLWFSLLIFLLISCPTILLVADSLLFSNLTLSSLRLLLFLPFFLFSIRYRQPHSESTYWCTTDRSVRSYYKIFLGWTTS